MPVLPAAARQLEDKPHGRGQPRKLPNGTWEDDDLVTEVSAVIGRPSDRTCDGAALFEEMCALANRVLPKKLTSAQRRKLWTLIFGGERRKPRPPEKASVIVRQLRAWRHDLTDPQIRKMEASLNSKARPPVKMMFR